MGLGALDNLEHPLWGQIASYPSAVMDMRLASQISCYPVLR